MQSSQLYYHGPILTMDPGRQCEALLVEDGKIKAVGSLEQMKAMSSQTTEQIDLQGMTLMPAFLDSHSHITALAQTLSYANLNGATSFQEIGDRLMAFVKKRGVEKGQWIIGFGYDHNHLKEKRHPLKDCLDSFFPENPVLITHASGHMGVMNSMALKEAGIGENTNNPQGGWIGRVDDSQEPNGYLEENAFMSASRKVPKMTLAEQLKNMEEAQQVYFSYGITTIQDGITKKEEWKLLEAFSQSGRQKADIVSYLDMKQCHDLAGQYSNYWKQYQNRLKIGGYKIFLDGSPQGRTAWMTKPYEKGDGRYCGYPIYTDEEVLAFVRQATDEKSQILAHCNGDAAAEQYLRMFEKVAGEGENVKELRPVMIHAQLLRQDQMPRLKKLGMIPSFFMAHVYYWGDTHIENFGMERAGNISPANSALKNNLIFTFHQDTPVIAPNMLETIWCAVNRTTAKGISLGPQECISVEEACKAVTENAAYSYFEEKEKGTLTPGKKADMIVLEENPFEAAKEHIKDISVLKTIKDGVVVYEK